jgi:uncharacterized membrane protein
MSKFFKYLVTSFFINAFIPFLLLIKLDLRDLQGGSHVEGIICFVIILVHFLHLLICIFYKRLISKFLDIRKIYIYNILSNCFCNLAWLIYYNIIEYLVSSQNVPVSIFNKYSFGGIVVLIIYFLIDIYISAKAFKG